MLAGDLTAGVRKRRGLPVLAACIAATGCVALEPASEFPTRVPEALAPTSGAVAVVGDLQMTPWLVRAFKGRERNERQQALLVADLRARLDDVAALVLLGDLVFNARSRRDWAHFDSLVAPIAAQVPVLPVLGNHDYHCWLVELCIQAVVPKSVRLRFPWLAPGMPYSVAFGDTALVFIDSETELAAQGAWLVDTLARAEQRFAAVVVFMHRPPYTDSVDADRDGLPALREHVVGPLRESALARLVVSGHEHGYEHQRVDGVDFVISAGGGGPRDLLRSSRPRDAYEGPNCVRTPSGRVLRPFNYMLIRREPGALGITARGLCRGDENVAEIASFEIPVHR